MALSPKQIAKYQKRLFELRAQIEHAMQGTTEVFKNFSASQSSN